MQALDGLRRELEGLQLERSEKNNFLVKEKFLGSSRPQDESKSCSILNKMLFFYQ